MIRLRSVFLQHSHLYDLHKHHSLSIRTQRSGTLQMSNITLGLQLAHRRVHNKFSLLPHTLSRSTPKYLEYLEYLGLTLLLLISRVSVRTQGSYIIACMVWAAHFILGTWMPDAGKTVPNDTRSGHRHLPTTTKPSVSGQKSGASPRNPGVKMMPHACAAP